MALSSTIAAVQEYLLNEPYDRFLMVLKTCLSDIKDQETYVFEFTEEAEHGDLVIAIRDNHWGSVGKITLTTLTNFPVRFQITPPEDPELGEVRSYEPKLRAAIPLTVHSLARLSSEGGDDDFQETLCYELHQMRLASHHELKKRVLQSLKIYSYHCVTGRLSPKGTEGRSWRLNPAPQKKNFKFKVHSSPARVAALARSLSNEDEGYETPGLFCELTDPLTGHPLGNLLPELPTLGVKLKQGEQSLDILAARTSEDQVELQVTILDEARHWRLWDRLRDHLEKQKLFTLIGVHLEDDTENKKCLERQQRKALRSRHDGQANRKPSRHQENQRGKVLDFTDKVPNIGNNHLILDLWRQGLTAKEIGQRTRRRPKTILNLLSSWRRKYGEELVPRRRAS
jgi:hypothetical protein